MFEKIGMAITAFGVMCADSRCLLIPVVIVAVGMFMVMIGERRSNMSEGEILDRYYEMTDKGGEWNE